VVTSGRADPSVGNPDPPPRGGRVRHLHTHPIAGRLARRLLDALRRDLGGLRAAVASRLGVRRGLLTYEVHPPGGMRRIHLRIDRDGCGLLLLDVTEAIHLNPTAALLARLALDHTPRGRAMRVLRGRFRGVDSARLGPEAEEIYALVEHVSTTTDPCPTCGLEGLARMPLFSTPVRAPYKADLALSYGCNNACRHCYNPPERAAMPSLSLTDWRRVLTRLARIGVPQVIFTGGEPTLIDGLPGLIRHAGRLGMVAGLNTNGRRLSDRALARSLAQAGLDHVQITLQSHLDEVHNAMTGADSFAQTVRGIRSALAAGLHTITNTTLTRRNLDHAELLVEFLHGLGLRTFAMNGMIYSGRGRTWEGGWGTGEGGRGTGDGRRGKDSPPSAVRRPPSPEDLAPVLAGVRDRAAELGMRFLWYTPTAYCRLSPLELELGPRRCNAAEYSICVEPNGDVLPCQSYYAPAGNILRDPWERIWNGRLFRSFRDRAADPRGCGLPEPCWECPDLSLCAGGCRIEREHSELMIAD
jgi:radical SAM protein with 4Fe4S-binding SPASM domain